MDLWAKFNADFNLACTALLLEYSQFYFLISAGSDNSDIGVEEGIYEWGGNIIDSSVMP